jgi:hypothetical protein
MFDGRGRSAMKVKEMWAWMVDRQKYIWVTLYLGAIPVFAWIYSGLDHAFFEPNIQLERSYGADANIIIEAACADLKKARGDESEGLKTEVLKGYGLWFSVESSDFQCVSPLSLKDNFSLSFSVQLDRVRIIKGPDITPDVIPPQSPYVSVVMPVSFPLVIDSYGTASFELHGPDLQQIGTYASDTRTQIAVDDYLKRRILRPRTGRDDPHHGISVLHLDAPLQEKIRKYASGTTGFTSDISDNYWRMAYFSAVTITTLGFGDIIPVTTEARGWVTGEAIAGVILVGLFLNSLTREAKRKPKDGASS